MNTATVSLILSLLSFSLFAVSRAEVEENVSDSCNSEEASCFSLPIIDLSESEAVSVEKLRFAARNYGFFYLSGHNITSDELQDLYSLSHAFFDMSDEQKNAIRMNHNQRLNGYVPLDASRLNQATNQSTPNDLRESYRMDFAETEFTNQFPEHYQSEHIDERLTQYVRKCENISVALLSLFAVSLGLEPAYFDQHAETHISTMYFHRYLPVASDVANHIYGVGPHTDYGIFTLLLVEDETDDALQILLNRTDNFQMTEEENTHSTWMRVKPMKDMFIVNVGEVISILTNDYYLAALHRVVMSDGNKSKYRHSIPFHFDPRLDATIQCIPQFVETCKYAPMTFRENLRQKLQNTIYDA